MPGLVSTESAEDQAPNAIPRIYSYRGVVEGPRWEREPRFNLYEVAFGPCVLVLLLCLVGELGVSCPAIAPKRSLTCILGCDTPVGHCGEPEPNQGVRGKCPTAGLGDWKKHSYIPGNNNGYGAITRQMCA